MEEGEDIIYFRTLLHFCQNIDGKDSGVSKKAHVIEPHIEQVRIILNLFQAVSENTFRVHMNNM